MSGINTNIINTDVYSGSLDSLRMNMGSYWESFTRNEFITYTNFNNISTNNLTDSYYLKGLYSQADHAETGSFLFPSVTMPVRLAADSSNIKDDNHWRTIMVGGNWGARTYTPIFTSDVFENISFNYDVPYPNLEAKLLADSTTSISSVINIGYNYRQYLAEYQNYSFNSAPSEHTLYCHYVAADLSRWSAEVEAAAAAGTPTTTTVDNGAFGTYGQMYDTELLNYISREGKYTEIFHLTNFDASYLPYAVPYRLQNDFNTPIRTENTYLSKEYLTSSYVQNDLSSSTVSWVQTRMRNMLFDSEAVVNHFTNARLPLNRCAPYAVNVSWPNPTGMGGEFLNHIETSGFSSKFIKTLYSAFSGEIEQLAPTDEGTIKASNYFTSSAVAKEVYDNKSNNYRSIEYDKMLAYCRNNFDTAGMNDNCMFIGEKNFARTSAQAENDKYRFFNTKASTTVMNQAINYVNSTLFNKSDLTGIYNTDLNYAETLAFRVEKIGGVATGDSRTQSVLQNFWMMRSPNAEFDFHDTQVKYGTDYTYTVYAYVLVVGTRYSANNLLLSRDLGCESADGTKVGLEMYNPSTGDRSAELFDSSIEVEEMAYSPGTGMSISAFRDYFTPRDSSAGYGNTFEIFSEFPYIADFTMKYQPVMKIVEVPLFTKTVRVLDHPGNVLQITPYQINDDSQRVGFKVFYDYFVDNHTYPSAITNDDISYKNSYLQSNDLNDNSILELESVAKPRYVQVYRMNSLPASINSFDGSLIDTIDLKIQNENIYTLRNAVYEDTVATNSKYYYLFRVLNQQGTVSQISEIYETQLVNDGGYKYAVFNVIDERELASRNETIGVSNTFKKIFQLQPNMQQIELITDGVDFSDTASSQIKNLNVGDLDDLIWDKTFKIRLTSKKTGKKIDLNVTYKLNSE